MTGGSESFGLRAMLNVIEDRHRRATRALNRLLWATLALAGLLLGAVPALAVSTSNPWLLPLMAPAIAVPVLFQQWGFRHIDRKYGIRR